MRKKLLFTAALCLATSAMVQASNPTAMPAEIGNAADATSAADGTVDHPFTLKDGENTVPAAAGKYYFLLSTTGTATESGFLEITSNATLTGGQVRAYGNYIHAKNDNPVLAKGLSTEGSYNLRVEIPYATKIFYVIVDKKQATDTEDTFTSKMTGYQAGESEGTAIQLTDFPKDLTMEKTEGTYYYSIDVPANSNKFLVITSSNDLSSGSSVSLYPKGNAYNAPTMQGKLLKSAVNNTNDQTYILKVVSANESNPISLNVAYKDIQAGELITMPKTATTGENTFDIDDDTEYFVYKATQDSKLTVTVKDGASVLFPKGTGKWDGNYTTIDDTYSIEVTKGTEYLIKVTGLGKGDTFTITETTFQAGESMSNPIIMDGTTYTLGDNASNLWLQYNVTKDGVIEISCDAPYDDESGICVSKNGEEATSVLETNGIIYAYKSKVFVKQGDKLYFNVMMQNASGKTITLTPRDYTNGESYTAPIILDKGKNIDASNANYAAPVWVRVSLPEGENKFRYFGGELYFSAYSSIKNIEQDEQTNVRYGDVVELPSGDYAQEFYITMEKAGDIYLKVTYSSENVTMTWVDDATDGIDNIKAATNGNDSIYTIDGRKVNQISGNGVYIIKSNGNSKKVVVKK